MTSAELFFTWLLILLSDYLGISACCGCSFIWNKFHKVYEEKWTMSKCPKIIPFKPYQNFSVGELNLNRLSGLWTGRTRYSLRCRICSPRNRKLLLFEMSEVIHKLLHTSRHEYLSITGIIIFVSFVDTVQTHNTRTTHLEFEGHLRWYNHCGPSEKSEWPWISSPIFYWCHAQTLWYST